MCFARVSLLSILGRIGEPDRVSLAFGCMGKGAARA